MMAHILANWQAYLLSPGIVACAILAHVVGLGLIASVAWLLVVMIDAGKDVVAGRHEARVHP